MKSWKIFSLDVCLVLTALKQESVLHVPHLQWHRISNRKHLKDHHIQSPFTQNQGYCRVISTQIPVGICGSEFVVNFFFTQRRKSILLLSDTDKRQLHLGKKRPDDIFYSDHHEISIVEGLLWPSAGHRDQITLLHERDDLVQESEQRNSIYQSILVWNLAKRLLKVYFNSLTFFSVLKKYYSWHQVPRYLLFSERGIFSPHALILVATKLTPYIGITL